MRSLKAGGASKGDVASEVATLLTLKQQLEQAQGALAAEPSAGSKKKKAGQQPPVPSTNEAPATADQAEVDRLQNLVSQQVCFLFVFAYFFIITIMQLLVISLLIETSVPCSFLDRFICNIV